jgi:hypothetical protein
MRFAWVVLLCPFAALPQDGARVGGVLLDRDGPAVTGEIGVRATDNQVFRYRFDSQTHVDRDGAAADIASLNPGDRVEVVSDHMPHADIAYALAIHVTPAAPRAPAALRSLAEPVEYHSGADLFFAGVIWRLSAARVVLRLRGGSDQTIVLLKSTRYMEGGSPVDGAALKPNMRVFVQAGKSLYGDVEAHEVIWGQIFQPE